MLNSRFFIITIFCIYTILLAHLSLLALFVLLIIIFAPALILLGGNIPQSLNFFVVIIVTEIFAVKIWIKALKYVRVLESGITSEIKKNVIWMLVMTIIISLGFFVLYTQNLSETANSHNQIIESNKYAVQNCGIIKDLCVTKEIIAYNADKNFGKKLKNAKNACSDLGMRLPTKEEFDVILSPLTSIKYALEQNLTDEEFVYLQRHYVKTLRDYPLISVDGNFLTSSIENGKVVTYKVDSNHNNGLGSCRSVRTKDGTRDVCIRIPIETPLVEYHDLNEQDYSYYSLLCVK